MTAYCLSLFYYMSKNKIDIDMGMYVNSYKWLTTRLDLKDYDTEKLK